MSTLDPGATNEEALRWLRARVAQFVGHLKTHHGNDERARALFTKLREVRLLDPSESRPAEGSWKNGKFKHSTGTLFVAPRAPDGTLRSESSLLKTVVHELAHATRNKVNGETAHSPQWKQTWLWFLGIATERLSWSVDIKCAECSFYGLCDRKLCPKCNWMQGLCRPYSRPRA